MTLQSVLCANWRCGPVVAAFLISRVVWAADHGLLVDDLERTNALAKRLQIALDEELVLEVHCMLNGESETSVEFLVPADLPAAHHQLAREIVVSAAELVRRERLVRRPLGFSRD